MNVMNTDTNNDRPTPITDHAKFTVTHEVWDGKRGLEEEDVDVVPSEIAEDLERQLADVTAQRDRIAASLEKLLIGWKHLAGSVAKTDPVILEAEDSLSQIRTPQPPTP